MSKKNFKKKETKLTIQKIFETNPNKDFTPKKISNVLNNKSKNIEKSILSILIELKEETFLKELQKGIFTFNNNYTTTFLGVLDSTLSGKHYVIVPELENDIQIESADLSNALDGDTVEVKITRKLKRKTIGVITKVIKRKTTQFLGTVEAHKKFAFLKIDSTKINVDLYIPLEKLKGAKTGQKAIGRITSWPKDVNNPFGEITEVLDSSNGNDNEMISILLKNDFSINFPNSVEQEVKKFDFKFDKKEIEKRKDFREKLTFTIDPADAKDFDDALSFHVLKNGNIEVGVHIADVSHYVQTGTELDKEAFKRGNSVYLEDRVIPMLPEQLSNIACSLRPNEDKYTFSAVFEIDENGKIANEWFGKTIIKSKHRFTYQEAQDVIKGKSDVLKTPILTLDKIAKKLRKEREKNGALLIESEEVRFVLDEDGNPVKIEKKIQEDANQLIEEFMLLANKKVALFVGKLPDKKGYNNQFIYRCHDKPAIEKLNTFSTFADKFGYKIEFENLDTVAQKINAFLSKIRKTPEFDLIQTMAIRSMAKANYQTNNIGHYGLAFPCYTHFTSPIRRYADLIVHRVLFDKLQNKNKNYGNSLNEISEHISAQERKAIEAERESNKFFQAKFLSDKIGEKFEGTVSGLTDFGMFVRLDDNYCEGMIMITNLPDDTYYFNPDKFQIVGRKTNFKFNFGDRINVKVTKVNLTKKQIDLKLI